MSRIVKPLKRSYTSMVAAVATSVGFGQMLFLKATYASPPDAFGPREGVERPSEEDKNREADPESLPEKCEVRVGTVTEFMDEVEDPTVLFDEKEIKDAAAAAGLREDNVADDAESVLDEENSPMPELSNGVAVSLRQNGKRTGGSRSSSRTGTGNPGTPLSSDRTVSMSSSLSYAPTGNNAPRVLVIGDSLVSGVGGAASWSDGPCDGPPLPKYVAKSLSKRWNRDVQWNAMSLTGGDVRMLRKKILPMLKRERDNGTIHPEKNPLTAVVLVTGVNDWKRMTPWRNAKKFRRDLCDFIASIRAEVGEDTHVFLPAIPGVHHAPRFHEPLRSFLIFINDYWDAQKLALSRSMANVHFVNNPPEADWTQRPEKFFCTQDRLHPSERGYSIWGGRIAAQIASATSKNRTASCVTSASYAQDTGAVQELAAKVAASATTADAAAASATAAVTASTGSLA